MAQLLLALREAVRQGVQTLRRLPDPDARFLRQGARYSVSGDPLLAYGYGEAQLTHGPPGPSEIARMEVVLDWLGWSRRVEGVPAYRRIMDWANGASIWTMASREKCSERTVHNRIDRSLNAILIQFGGQNDEIEEIDEPLEADQNPLFFVVEVPRDTSAALGYGNPETVPARISGKVYVAGLGFMRNGRVVRDGRERAERI